jgi:hypothetical protein
VRPLAKTGLALAALAGVATATTTAMAGGGGGGFVAAPVIGFSSPGGHAVFAQVEAKGEVRVDFHGDPATGCEQAHLCDVEGTVRWNPAGSGTLLVLAYRERGKRFEEGFLSLGDEGPDGASGRAKARVSRRGAPGSLCADSADASGAGSTSGPRRGSALLLRLIGGGGSGTEDVLRTRCAGPLAADVATLIPSRRISERRLTRGQPRLDFSADRTFSAHGLSGTVHSSVVLKIVQAERVPNVDSPSRPSRGTRTARRRALDVRYRVERVSGAVVASVHGVADPDECGPLDACGLSGSVTLSHLASSGGASLFALASARHSRGDLLRALGVAAGPRPRGVEKYGSVNWDHDRGGISADLSRNGAPACADSAPVPGGGASLELRISRRRVTVGYLVDPFGAVDVLRTRCPGPQMGDAAGSLASGSFPLSIFRHRRVTLRLRRGTTLGGVGYGGRTRPDVTVVLRRTRIHEHTFSEELPPDYPGETVRPIH